jgi:protein gp37
MSINSKIEWTNHTANLWWGCTEVHEGCKNCYACSIANRWGHHVWGNNAGRRIIRSVWDDLKKYQRLAQEAGEVHRVFVGSMMDIFEKSMSLVDSEGNPIEGNTGNLRDQLFTNVSDGLYPNLLFLLLTKRPSNINRFIPEAWKACPPVNVMFGTSPVNQETANKLVEQLVQVNGKRFLSVEPQLADLSLMRWLQNNQIDWVIQGGESGNSRRPFDTDWANKLRAECDIASAPYFFKQIDKVREIPDELLIRNLPDHVIADVLMSCQQDNKTGMRNAGVLIKSYRTNKAA